MIGNQFQVLIFSISLMLFSLIAFLLSNLLIKNLFKTKRPTQYSKNKQGNGVFKGSFPSFHSQFAAGEATTYIVVIALYSPEVVRSTATIIAIFTAGAASIIVAWSRVSLNQHYPRDAIGGIGLGILIGFAVPYWTAPLLWSKFPLIWQIVASMIFFASIYILSRSQRGFQKY